MYKIKISNKAAKEIDKLPDFAFLKIDELIQKLKVQPRPVGVVKLIDIGGYRMRTGDYRIL